MGRRRKRHPRARGIWTTEYGGMPVWGIVASVVLMIGLGTFALVASSQQVQADYTAKPRPAVTFTPKQTAPPTRVAIVGDSNTEADSPDFVAGQIGAGSWVSPFLAESGAVFAGGWADGGTTSTTQAQNLAPAEADVLLIMTGTNDVGQRVPFETTVANIDAMVAKVPAGHVVLLAVPPRDVELDPTTEEFNAQLAALAAERGWQFHDGLAFLRSPEGGFVEGTTDDGIHLTWEAQQEYGRGLAALVSP